MSASSFYFPFKTSKELLTKAGKNTSKGRQAFTEIKKAGLVIKHKNQHALHPLIYTRKSGTPRLEEVIKYYYLFFDQNTFDKFGILYEEGKNIPDLFKQVKFNAVKDFIYQPSKQDKKQQQKLREIQDYFSSSNISSFITNEELDQPISDNQNIENEVFYNVFQATEVPAEYRSFRQAILNSYRNFLYDYIRTLLELHIEIFSEQNLVKHYSGVEYHFYELTTCTSLIDYKKTQAYQRITSPMSKPSIDPLDAQLENMDGVISTTASEHLKEIKEKLTLPVNITNEINPIEDEAEESLPNYLIEEPDFITHSVKTVQGELEYRVSINTNNKSICHLPDNYYEEYNKQQKLELERELTEMDKRYQEHINSLNQHKLNKMFEEYNKSHRIEVQLTPPLAHRIYPNCSLQDADLSRELYYNLS